MASSTALSPARSISPAPSTASAFQVTLIDASTHRVSCDAYQQEGPLLSFFELAEGRTTVDSWSVRVASFRTADVSTVRSCAAAIW